MPVCTKCNEPKDSSDFYKDKSKKFGIRPQCKSCDSVNYKNKKRLPSYKGNQLRRYWPNCTPDEALTNYFNILKQQNGKCAICFIGFSEVERQFAVDHCHTTGKIRGLLCENCNRAIGLLQDNPETIINAASYITTKGIL